MLDAQLFIIVPCLTENTIYLGYKDQIMARVRKHTHVFVYGVCYVMF